MALAPSMINSSIPQLLERIRENKEEFSAIFQHAEDLCTAVDSTGASLLHYTSELGNAAMTEFLIKAGTKVDLQDKQGRTPLMLATKNNQEETIRVLLKHKADIYICNNDGVCALKLAVMKGLRYPNIVKMFLDKTWISCCPFITANRLMDVYCPLPVAVSLKSTMVVKWMLWAHCRTDVREPDTNYTALHVAAQNQHLRIVELLVDKGLSVNDLDVRNQTPLALIRDFEDIRILTLLVNKGTNLTACTDDAAMQVYWALTSGTYQAVKVIVESGFDLYAKDLNEQTVIHYLAMNVNEGIVDILEKWIGETDNEINKSVLDGSKKVLEKFIDWNAQDKDGRAPLHCAMHAGNASFVEYLLSKGVDVNVQSFNGVTPFFETLERSSKSTLKQRIECLKLIIEAGADFEIGQLLTQKILSCGKSEAVGVILHLGVVDLQAKDLSGQTALHYLANNVNEGIAEVVEEWISDEENRPIAILTTVVLVDTEDSKKSVEKSIDWNVRDEEKRTPLHIAMAAGNVRFVEYLIQKNVDLNVQSVNGWTPFFEALESSSESMLDQRVECVKLILENGVHPKVEIERYLEKYNNESSIIRDCPLLEPLLTHLVLRQAKGEQISEKLLESINCHPKLKDYVDSCKEELERMKKTTFFRFNMNEEAANLFDFLIEKYDVLLSHRAYRFRLRDVISRYESDSYLACILHKRYIDIYEKYYKLTRADTIFTSMILAMMFSFITGWGILLTGAVTNCTEHLDTLIVILAVLFGFLFIALFISAGVYPFYTNYKYKGILGPSIAKKERLAFESSVTVKNVFNV